MSRRKLPEPLVPADVDCRKLAGFMLNTERLLASELWALSTGEELKAALALWCRSWKQLPAGSLPNDERVLASFAGVTVERWGTIREVALRGWVECNDGRLYHPVLCEEARRAFAARVRYRDGLDKTKERMRQWRDRQREKRGKTSTIGEGSPPETHNETRHVTRNVRVPLRARDGTESRPFGTRTPPPGVAPPPEAGATAPSEADGEHGEAAVDTDAARRADSPGLEGPANRAAAAAAPLNPDANPKLRALLGKLGLPATPQAACEWEWFVRKHGLTKATAAASFLRFIAKRGDCQYARFATPEIIAEWRHGAAPT